MYWSERVLRSFVASKLRGAGGAKRKRRKAKCLRAGKAVSSFSLRVSKSEQTRTAEPRGTHHTDGLCHPLQDLAD
ncbi:hypothetical protein NQZ68_037816 [Dissostichus eleginoides]|nr:hypothetical protein NQZ68_037816 [Dissostichus eleginoides]